MEGSRLEQFTELAIRSWRRQLLEAAGKEQPSGKGEKPAPAPPREA